MQSKIAIDSVRANIHIKVLEEKTKILDETCAHEKKKAEQPNIVKLKIE
jgi:hypothetical protein